MWPVGPYTVWPAFSPLLTRATIATAGCLPCQCHAGPVPCTAQARRNEPEPSQKESAQSDRLSNAIPRGVQPAPSIRRRARARHETCDLAAAWGTWRGPGECVDRLALALVAEVRARHGDAPTRLDKRVQNLHERERAYIGWHAHRHHDDDVRRKRGRRRATDDMTRGTRGSAGIHRHFRPWVWLAQWQSRAVGYRADERPENGCGV